MREGPASWGMVPKWAEFKEEIERRVDSRKAIDATNMAF